MYLHLHFFIASSCCSLVFHSFQFSCCSGFSFHVLLVCCGYMEDDLNIKYAPNMDTWKNIKDIRSGKLHPYSFADHIKSYRTLQLQLSNLKELISPNKGAINSLHVLFIHTTLISHILYVFQTIS